MEEYIIKPLSVVGDAFIGCIRRNSAPRRRHSLPNTTSPRFSRSEETGTTNSTPSRTGRTDTLSFDTVSSSKDLYKEIQHSTRTNRKKLSFKDEKPSQGQRNSDASTSELVQIHVLRESVVAEIHETESSRLRHRSKSHESLVSLEEERRELAHQRDPIVKSTAFRTSRLPRVPLNISTLDIREAIATSKFTSSGLRYYNTSQTNLTQRYLDELHYSYPYACGYNPPPSPAPDSPENAEFPTFDVNGIYCGNFLPIESARSELREPCIGDFLLSRRQTENREIRPLARSDFSEFRPQATSLPCSPRRYQQTLSTAHTIFSDYSEELPRNCWNLPKVNLSPTRRGGTYNFEQKHSSGIPQSYEFDETRTRNIIPYRKNQARKFLELSDFEDAVSRQQPQECFRRPIEERFLERCPAPVRPIDPCERPRLTATPSTRPRRESRRHPSSLGYPTRRSRSYDSEYRAPMGRMNPLDDHERKVIIEFCHLLEKSKQLFNGLRELPQYGHKQWHSYFGKTFDVYTKLWKFQQQHRAILDNKYGLKRWQIGEIASKIGQLYYHFYLRTSDTVYLSEAYSFYYAIRGRSYYTQACKEDKCELMVKKLRYYARFIVAGLLLKKVKLVKDLLKELDKQIIEYGNAYEPDDQNEWRIVADEVRSFIKVEPVVSVHHPEEYVVILSHRLSPQVTPPVERTPAMTLSLQEVLIIGSNSTQVKFSELTMDMFRMMQTLEREPTGDIQHMYDESPRQRYTSTPSAVNNKGYTLDSGNNKPESPHKYLLFKPSPNQIFVYLASACDDLPPNGAVLVYMSAEGLIVPPLKHPEDAGGYDIGGLITTSKTDILQRETTKEGKPIPLKHKELQVLHPGDLYPFTRRPMCIIVDSDNSFAFNSLPRYFGQPLIILMSPIELPATLYPTTGDKRVEGSLFTLFLHCPLSAVCLSCDIKKMSLINWERAQTYIDSYLAEAAQMLVRSRTVSESMYVSFMGDDFLRLLILRFIFCETILRMHRMFRGRLQRTRSSPPLPDDLYEHPTLTHIVIDLVTHLQVRGHFHDPAAAPPPNRE